MSHFNKHVTGSSSCQNGDILISAPSSGNIYMSKYNNNGDKTISASNKYDIICSGGNTCQNQEAILIANNLYCGGHYGCYNVDRIENINNNIYSLSFFSMLGTGTGSIINNVGNSVYCGGFLSCISGVISNVTNDVIGDGYVAMASGIINNIGGNVVGYGNSVLANTRIYNASKLFCIGDFSCSATQITGVLSITAIGNESPIDDSTIWSNISNIHEGKNTMSVRINGSNTNDYNIYCTLNDICRINCQSSNACEKLHLYCFGTCIVNCNYNNGSGIICPILEDGNPWLEWYTTYPTTIPTNIPSIAPSEPSIMPTVNEFETTENETTIIDTLAMTTDSYETSKFIVSTTEDGNSNGAF